MRRLIWIAVLGLAGTTLYAQRGSVGYTFKGSYFDSYVYRGHLYNPGDTAQAELTIGKGNFSYSALAAEAIDTLPLIDGSDYFESELTHTVSFTTAFRGQINTYGYIFYDYDNGIWPDTQEIFFRSARSGGWNPSYGIAVDFDTYKGSYFDASITRAIPFTRHSRLLIHMLLGLSYDLDEKVNDDGIVTEPGYFEDDGLNHGKAQLKWVWQRTNWFKFEIGGDYHHGFDDSLMDDAPEDFEVVWGASFSIIL